MLFRSLFIGVQKFSTDQGVERYRDKCRALKASTDVAIERCPSVHSKASSMDRGGIEGIGDFSIDPPSYREVSRLQ